MAKKYGTEVAERLKAFGGDDRRLIEQYGDELADIIGRLSDIDAKKAIELINAYGDDALELFKDGKNVDSVRRIFESGKINVVKRLVSQICDVRSKMPNNNLSKRGNMAAANVEIPGLKRNYIAHSKINSLSDTGADIADFSLLKQVKEFLLHM